MSRQELLATLLITISLSVLAGAFIQRTLDNRPKPSRGAKGCHTLVEMDCEPRGNKGIEIQRHDGEVIRFR